MTACLVAEMVAWLGGGGLLAALVSGRTNNMKKITRSNIVKIMLVNPKLDHFMQSCRINTAAHFTFFFIFRHIFFSASQKHLTDYILEIFYLDTVIVLDSTHCLNLIELTGLKHEPKTTICHLHRS